MSDLAATIGRLKAGIKISFDEPQTSVDRVKLSDGVIELDPDVHSQYSHPAFVPKLPWRQPTALELANLINPEECDCRSETITIVKFPEATLDLLRNTIDRGETEHGASVTAAQITDYPDYTLARSQIQQYILKKYARDRDLDCRGLIRTNIGLITTTINAVEFLPAKLFAGLHLDSWDYLPFRRRHHSRNRICINLGREARYFLLINLTLKQIFDTLNLVDPDDIYSDYRGVRLPNKFMCALPDYPVVKIAIYPSEAYIAPTENFIHDATSTEKTIPDWSMNFLGNFQS